MANEIQSLVLDDWLGVGGDLTLGFDGTDTGVMTMLDTDSAYDFQTTMQNAFDAAYGSGDMSVSVQSSSDPIEYHIEFTGDYAELDVALLTNDADTGPQDPVITEYQRGGDHYEDTADGGILFAGDCEDIHGIGYSDTGEGGIVFAGDCEDIHGIGYSDTATGGIRFGGAVVPSKTTAVTGTGGILFAGSVIVGYGDIRTASGGIRFGTGITESQGYNNTATGGIRFGGDGVLVLDYTSTGTGGIVFGQARYSNGYRYRVAIVIPAGKVSADLSRFLLPVRTTLPLDLASASVAFSDSAGNAIPHDLVGYSTSTGLLRAYVKCDVAEATDTTLYLYFGE